MRMSVPVRASLALGRHYFALLGLPDAKRLIAEAPGLAGRRRVAVPPGHGARATSLCFG
jgi:hypothetical protein